ncbi:MAG: hypothetical protein H9864_02000 [Candidatus Faecalibacterium intestinavium]|uniref:Flagellin N-terminal domain-containing protein n=1 Tax=Candidatus Faecalibacterium intestinavium TaxID=2838580 RepID=A0A9E2KKB1_9FIRM|nr:hypothetical protein [Candidatus Faecalibacterium intestinavium]
MFRVTTNGTLYTYKKNMLKTSNKLYSAMNTLMTGRNFDSYSADPAAATRAFRLHSSLNATNTQASNNDMVFKKFSTAWDVADSLVNELSHDLAQTPLLEGLNQPNWSNLNTQGDIILSGAKAMVQSLNSTYNGKFLFNGADTENPPFAIETETVDHVERHFLTYRGVRLDDLNPDYYDQVYKDSDGKYIEDPEGKATITENGVTKKVLSNEQILEKWSNEHQYVDIGLGFAVDNNGDVLDSTAFDASISGMDFIGGYGLDDDGNPKNIISIMLRSAEIFKGYNQETGKWSAAGDIEDARALVQKFTKAQEDLSNQHVSFLEAQAQFLETNQNQLESTFYAQNEQLNNIERVDQVEAILALVSAQTGYNAALQAGANVVPQSLMDYLK